MTDDAARDSIRRRLLEARGFAPETIDALLAYGDTPGLGRADRLPLPDEPFADAWRRFESEAQETDAVATLTRHFPQMRFPIEPGISQRDAYREATRRGAFDRTTGLEHGLPLRQPSRIAIEVFATMGGGVPAITVDDRRDFETLVQAFTARNEPDPVPPAMGACLIRGLTNWSRVDDHRAAWEARRGDATSTWADEFARLAGRPVLYQDNLVLLSRGPYSAVGAADAGLDERDWLARSLVIRREHECTHYFTRRVFGWVRDHVVDELLADFIGLLHAFGRYRPALAEAFLGLEGSGVRPDGRLWIYRGRAALPDEAMPALAALAELIKKDTEKWATVIKKAGIKIQ